MRRWLTWLAGALGLAALARHRARRRAAAADGPSYEADPAEELRRKLAEQRHEPDEPAAAHEVEPAAVEPAAADGDDDPVDLDARRAEVHARAQEAIDLMRDEPSGPGGGAVA